MRNVDMIGLPRGGSSGSKAMSRSSAAANKEVKTLENCAKYRSGRKHPKSSS
jgi:hypothetical protein